MIGLIQRVASAEVRAGEEILGAIGPGLLVLVGVQRDDTEREARRLAERLVRYRVFPDAQGRMNLDVSQVEGSILLVPQFTLAADTRRGNRPGFEKAAHPSLGEALFERLVGEIAALWPNLATGRFGADMDVELVNRGPVTFWLEVTPNK